MVLVYRRLGSLDVDTDHLALGLELVNREFRIMPVGDECDIAGVLVQPVS